MYMYDDYYMDARIPVGAYMHTHSIVTNVLFYMYHVPGTDTWYRGELVCAAAHGPRSQRLAEQNLFH